MVPPAPMTDHPHGIRMRARRPVSTNPYPVIAPGPAAGNPEPDIHGTRTGRNHFDLWRWRCSIHHHFARGSNCHRPGLAINHTAGRQGQACGDEKGVDEKPFIHTTLPDDGRVTFVTDPGRRFLPGPFPFRTHAVIAPPPAGPAHASPVGRGKLTGCSTIPARQISGNCPQTPTGAPAS